jgi:7-cyano-7-deazaguanine synthase
MSRTSKYISNGRRAWVLLSGGIDSSACVAFYLEQEFRVAGIFVDYGQIAMPREVRAAEAVAKHYRIPLTKLKWTGVQEKPSGLILGRNAFLLVGALMELPEDRGILSIGIHAGTHYQDCKGPFVRKMQSLFDTYTKGKIQIGIPFLKWIKSDIWQYSISRRVPLDLTYSCERGENQPCGLCLSCQDLERLYAST